MEQGQSNCDDALEGKQGLMICYLLRKIPLTFMNLWLLPLISPSLHASLKIDKLTQADLVGNPEGDRCPFDLCKPLPLKGRLGHLTVPAKYFFNNDLEYLKSTHLEKKYTTSITKTKAAIYELVGIEDMIPKQWSATKVGNGKDAAKGIKHWGPKREL
ncbi:hypothetical protein Tco_0696794, partial [Tanacetum coccineum]